MIKTNAPIMQTLYQPDEVPVAEERRTFLAQKGKILYAKYCGTRGHGICSESFAEYHIWRGELVIARDFLVFLDAQVQVLLRTSPCTQEIQQQLAMTEGLIERIRGHLGE